MYAARGIRQALTAPVGHKNKEKISLYNNRAKSYMVAA